MIKKVIITIMILAGILASAVVILGQKQDDVSKPVDNIVPVSSKVKNVIPIAMAADNNYVYPTLVAMTSVMAHAKSNVDYEFYLMVPSNFSTENKNIIKSLKNNYENFSVNIINMGEAFKNANTDSRITTPAYYRLNLPNLLPDVDKIIWLDGDTFTFKDLTEMINLDMTNYYYKGFLDHSVDLALEFGVNNDHYICTGVMLINLKALREDKVQEKCAKFIDKNSGKLTQHDQTVINVVCCDKVGVLPPKFGIWNYADEKTAIDYNNKLKPARRYNKDEFLKAYKDPTIVHYAGGGKPWSNNEAVSKLFNEKWWNCARLTNYFGKIAEKYKSKV